ncbi:MAG: DUF3552 domain-containing protein, partial [Clostridiales bacterium]|nr:DUF3552 domain-containing protein [Clostridiales bacterium]
MAISGFVMYKIGYNYRKKIAEKEIGGAEAEAKEIVEAATKQAEAKKRESIVEAREEIHRQRAELEREVKERRSELSKSERRLQQKEESLDRKHDSLDQKEETLKQKIKENEQENEEIKKLKAAEQEILEKLSGFTAEEAKEYLIKTVEAEARQESAIRLMEIDAQLKEEADDRARNYISLAIQKCAADHVSEVTVSVVPLPNDEMKGRIIGREGRNIRALETLTGVDLIIDDTPEAITLSSFDPV